MRRAYNEFCCFQCENKRVLITHIGGYPRHYSPAAVRMIQTSKPDIFIAGHSHILKVMFDPIYQLLHINPGAAGQYGFHKVRTAIRFTIVGDDIRDMEIGEWPRLMRNE
jgi:predicted phosphodiesterase